MFFFVSGKLRVDLVALLVLVSLLFLDVSTEKLAKIPWFQIVHSASV